MGVAVLTFCAALLYNPTTFDKIGMEKNGRMRAIDGGRQMEMMSK